MSLHYVKSINGIIGMDHLEKTQQLLKATEMPKERIAADCGIALGSVYGIMKPKANPGFMTGHCTATGRPSLSSRL